MTKKDLKRKQRKNKTRLEKKQRSMRDPNPQNELKKPPETFRHLERGKNE